MDAATIWLGVLQAATLLLVLALIYRPLGDCIARIYTSSRDLAVERGTYRLIGVDPRSEQTWQAYLRGVLVFSAIGVLLVYALQRFQAVLPYSLGLPAVPEGLSFNTAVSFVTNTNWQSYSPELTLGYTVQLAGLAVQNFVSAAVGIAVAVALVRGFAARRSGTLGNFWVDLVRGLVRLLLPLSIVAAIALIVGGVVQNFNGFTDVTTLTGGTQVIPGGPVASQEAIKELGTNGGGFFNTNSAHPFENPAPWTSFLEILMLLAIPVAMPRAFGRMVGDNRQGYAILGAMATIAIVSIAVGSWLEALGQGTAPQLAGGAMEGKETRFGILGSTLFAGATTLTSTGAVNSMHDSYTALGGMMPMLNMMLGEVAPGGVGSGLYGMLILAVLAVFVGGLLVGRSPEYLGKRMGPREIKLASLYILVTPTLVLLGTALSFGIPAIAADVESVSIWNPGIHGMSEVLYAFTSAANNNGSAFAGLTANTPWLNTALGRRDAARPLHPDRAGAGPGRIPRAAGCRARRQPEPCRPTGRSSSACSSASTVIVTALTYFPVLALGPLAEGLV